MIDVRRGPAAVRLLLALALAASCGACSGGEPPAPAAPPAPGAITLPPRPYDVPIDDIDPCSLLTPAQLADLQLDAEPRRLTTSGRLLGTTSDCSIYSLGVPADSTNIALAVVLAPDTGIERYTSGELLTDISPASVEGFPAVLATPRDFTDVCNVIIDIAPGQLIDIDYSDGGNNQPLVSQDRLCAGAIRVAEAVMRTLLAR